MPAKFNSCVSNGGKVRTIKVNAKEYVHVCYPKGSKKGVSGEVKKYKKV
jgi:hypothetical protein